MDLALTHAYVVQFVPRTIHVKTIRIVEIVVMIVSSSISTSRAGILFGDGQKHVIDGPTTGITMFGRGTSLVIDPGATIKGADGTLLNYATAGVSAGGIGTMVTMRGGTVTGGSSANSLTGGSPGITTSAPLVVSGGTVNGGLSPYLPITPQAGIAVDAIGPVTISGGTFNGGGGGYALRYKGNYMDISGGIFNGGLEITNGGTFFDSSGLTATISGGIFNGGRNEFRTFDGASTVISGGLFAAENTMLIGGNSSAMTIQGGSFMGGIWLNLFNDSTLTILGSNLAYKDRQLTGTLLDGSAISIAIAPAGNFHVTNSSLNRITFTGDVKIVPPPQSPVPEPNSLGMIAGAFAAILVATRLILK